MADPETPPDDNAEGDDIPPLPRRSWARWLAVTLLLCAIAALAIGTVRLAQVERRELELASEPRTLSAARELPTATRLSARLMELELSREQHATFELCALADLADARFRDAFEVLILHAEASKLMLRVPLDAAHLAHVQGDAARSCLLLGKGLIEHTGTYRIEAVWPKQPPPEAALTATLWVRLQASPELERRDLITICALGGLVLLLLALALRGMSADTRDRERERHSDAPSRLIKGVAAPVCALALFYLAMQWPSSGGFFTLLKGFGLLTLQLGVPFVLLTRTGEPDKLGALGLKHLAHPALSALLAVVSVPMLVAAARLSMRIVPSTEIAPIQTFIAWPSGMLSAALLGVLLPLGEELFFRGYLFGAWLRYGRTFAALASIAVFGLMHLEQSWGNWGGLLAICMTGAVLTALRLITGSVCLSAISHVAYNLTLSVSTLAAATSP